MSTTRNRARPIIIRSPGNISFGGNFGPSLRRFLLSTLDGQIATARRKAVNARLLVEKKNGQKRKQSV